MREEIIGLLTKLQEGYSSRKVEEIDLYSKDLFVDSDEMVILGTSDGEWCLGLEESKELLVNDWKYWGDVIFDISTLKINPLTNSCHFRVEGSVRYDFKASEDTYNSFLEEVKAYITNPQCWMGEIGDETRLTTIAWELGHLLIGEGKSYNWKFALSGFATKTQEGYRFNQLQFAIPTSYYYPDERFWENNCYIKSHENASEKLSKYTEQRTTKEDDSEYIRILKDIVGLCHSQDNDNNSIILDKDVSLYGTEGEEYLGIDNFLIGSKNYKDKWDWVDFDVKDVIYHRDGDFLYFITQGVAHKKITRNQAIELEIDRVKSFLDQEVEAKAKLSRISLSILTMLNEQSKGEDFRWPIRIEGIAKLSSKSSTLINLNFTYPCNILLEGKNYSAKIVD